MRDLSRQIFYMLLVRPALLLLLGFNIRHLDRLNADRPHLVAANHNSHLDALVLMGLFRGARSRKSGWWPRGNIGAAQNG